MTVSERFLKYVSFGTNSDESSESCPSTESQLILGKYLAEELKSIGLSEVTLDGNGYVYGVLPATAGRENEPSVGFIAHMDTAPAVKGDGIKPQTVHYEGGDIRLSESVSIRVKDFPYLGRYVGCDIITTDGTTLLGSDDKAGIAEIFTACEYLVSHPEISHGRIAVAITPDEEIGRGADRFDVERFACDWAYTVDGGELGEIEYENFNAASAVIKIHGINIHPGSAKNKMKNASLLAAELISRMPAAETPAHTEGYEGFYHLCDMKGDETLAELSFIIRDHSMEKFLSRKKFMADLVSYLNGVYGESTFEAEIKDSYYNMKEKILPVMHIIDKAAEAMRASGVEPMIVPIRGGTDGARLSFMGLPCPNLSTGGANFHGIHEFIPVQSMEKMTEVLVTLMKN
ncbi:MAG: peptidase T [Ruminococcaceae bacterium]|nr:peptidase T [Oscillospiraceae bacterium]